MEVDYIYLKYFEELKKDISENEIEEIACIWRNNYLKQPVTSLAEFGLLLSHTGGIPESYTDLENILNISYVRDILGEDAINSQPAIYNKLFCKKFKFFVDCILRKNSWNIFDNISDLNYILRLLKDFLISPWNSMRAVVYITGLRIMTQAGRCFFYLIKSSSLIEKNRAKTANEIWGNIYIDIFGYNFRDPVSHLRVIPLFELTEWFQDCPQILMKEMFFKYIQRSLNDRALFNKKIAIQLVHTIFLEPIITKQQRKLFEVIRPHLFNLILIRDSRVPVYCLKTINNACRFLGLNLSLNEEKSIMMSLYDRRASVSREAVYYFNNISLKNIWNVTSILKIVNIYRTCPVKSPIVVVKQFLEFFVSKTTWQDWQEAIIRSTHENICDCLAIFSEFVCIVMKAEPGLNRKITLLLDDYNLKESYVTHFETSWFNLMGLDHIKTEPRALYFLIKVVHLFYSSDLSANINEELVKAIFRIFFEHQEYILIKECIIFFGLLENVGTSSTKDYTRNFIPNFIEHACEIIANYSIIDSALTLIRLKVVLILKCFYFETTMLWDCLISALTSYTDFEKVEDIVIMMYNIILNDRRYFVELQTESRIKLTVLLKEREPLNLVTLRLRNRFFSFKNILYLILKDVASLSLNYTAAKAFGELLKHFGKHLLNTPVLTELVYEVNDDELMIFVKYCSSFMLIDCPQPKNACCIMLKTCVQLMNDGKMSLSVLKYFIQHIGKVHKHSVIILQTLNNIAKNPVSAVSIVNGLIIFYNERKNEMKVDQLDSQLESMLEFIVLYNPLPSSEYQILGINMYQCVENLLNQGYTVFSGVWNKIKCSLLEEVLQRLEKR